MELVRFPSSGGFSVRSIFTFVLAVFVTVLLWTTLSVTPAQAQQANWSGDMIVFENHGYSLDSSFTDQTNTVPSGATVYKTPAQDVDTNSGVVKRVFILYFSPGLDPPAEVTANYVEFDLNNGQLTNPSNRQTVNLTPKGQESASSSCAVSGVGWIICPATTYLAEGMDAIFDILSGMIAAQPPILGDQNNSLYKAWDVMRSIANVAFVIAFLIIIYSQLTGFGVTNYGIKKLVPRLIVAAILVNVSFIISALAIDISNILGYSVQDAFVSIRESLVTITDDNIGGAAIETNWATVASVALSAGGAIGGVWYLSVGSGWLIVPILLGAFLTIVLVILILAARQAIIVILVIISPLAFIANLLPNTEKLFDKWKNLFMTMLVFFPAFSLVFGGSQLAGQIIIQNAGTNLVMVIFGLAVQVAPLVITPLILKLSGGLLGKIAQIANDPKKGVLDRNRNWAQRRAEHTKQASLNPESNRRFFNPARWGSRLVQGSEDRRRKLEDSTERHKKRADNRYKQTKGYRQVYDDMADATSDEERVRDDNAHRVENLKRDPNSKIHGTAMRAAVSKERLETSQNSLKTYYNAQRNIGGTALNISGTNLEESKAYLAGSEKDREAYLNQYRSNRATVLGRAAESLEASNLNAEGWQNEYTRHVENLKLTPNSGVHVAAKFAASTKEHSEAAQQQVQAMLDRDRNTVGTNLHASTISLNNAKLEAETAQSNLTAYVNDQKARVDGLLHVNNTRMEAAKAAVQASETKVARVVAEYKTGHTPDGASVELTDAIERIRVEHQNQAIEKLGTDNAVKEQNDRLANELIRDEALRERAGGIREQGADGALASAISTVRTAYGQSVTEARQIIKHFNLSSDQRQDLALGRTVTINLDDGTSHTFTAEDTFAREAAIEDQIAVGTINQVEALVMRSGLEPRNEDGEVPPPSEVLTKFRTTIAEALGKNGLGGKSVYLGGKTIDDVGKGTVNGPEGILTAAIEAIGRGKISEKDLSSIDSVAVERLLHAARRIDAGEIPEGISPTMAAELPGKLLRFSAIARKTLTGTESVNVKEGAVTFLEQLGQITDPNFRAPSDDV